MNNTKKIISVVLVLVMLVSTLALSASAWTGTGSQELKFDVTADKTVVSAGDTVTVTCKLNLSDAGTWANTYGGFAISWLYNSNILTPTADNVGFGPVIAEFAQAKACGKIVTATALTQVRTASTAAEQAVYDENGYNAICKVQCVKDASTTYGSQGYWEATDGMTLFTVKFTVNDSVADGTVVHFDMLSGLFTKNHTYLQAIDTAAGNKGTNKYGAQYYDTSTATLAIPVGSAATTPVEFQKAQIRFKGITATSGAATYQNSFDVRTVAQITEANFATFFTDEATAKAKITDFGFVYAAKSNVATFDADTAKTVAEGGSAANYVKVPVTYMQHTGGNYIFTCLISNIADADKTDGVNCLGYVCFDGTYYYFDAAASVDFNTLYTTNMPA